MMVREKENLIRKKDPEFSIANFYSSIQNKVSSVIFAENEEQIQAFSVSDLTGLMGKYSDVVGVDVDRMEIADYSCDDKLQRAAVDVFLILTRYNGKSCRVKKEMMRVKLEKNADCMSQIVCAPAITRCEGCGSTLDFLQGKQCTYCKREVDLKKYDWAIKEIVTQ